MTIVSNEIGEKKLIGTLENGDPAESTVYSALPESSQNSMSLVTVGETTKWSADNPGVIDDSSLVQEKSREMTKFSPNLVVARSKKILQFPGIKNQG